MAAAQILAHHRAENAICYSCQRKHVQGVELVCHLQKPGVEPEVVAELVECVQRCLDLVDELLVCAQSVVL